MHTLRRPAPIGASLLLAGSLALAGCSGASADANPSTDVTVPVRVAPVSEPGALTVAATGTLGAKDEIPLGFKIGGVVARVLVDEGARVRAGDLLAELDLREIDAGVAKATLGAEKARRDAARVERLYHDSVATLAQWQDAQTAREAAEADLRAARVNREYAVITAPGAGVVLRRNVNAGAQIASGAPVLLFGSAGRGSVVRVGLADRDVLRVRPGDAATVVFDAYPDREFTGRVRQVGASADARTGTFPVEVAVDDVSGLPSGLVARVRITARGPNRPSGPRGARGATAPPGVTSVPADALVDGNGTRGTVFTLDASRQRAVRRSVTLVGMDGDRVLVRGLAGATQVITAGAAWLKDSARVEVKP